MGCVSTWMGDCLSALLISLLALRLAPENRNPFLPCLKINLEACLIVGLQKGLYKYFPVKQIICSYLSSQVSFLILEVNE